MDEPTALLAPVSTRSLSDIVADGPMPMGKGLELLGVIAGAIAKLHASGRTHGGLSASIIRVQQFESGPPAVIFLDLEATREMSPGADQYQLGVLAFQVLAGRPPKANESLRDAVPEAPTALDKLVAKLMAPKPSDRLAAAGAQRQLLDLAGVVDQPEARTVVPLGERPQLKKKPEANPFADDEATATVSGPSPIESTTVDPDAEPMEPLPELTPPPPPTVRGRAGPAMEDEPTQFAPVKWNKKKPAEEDTRTPLPPPVPTPAEERPVAIRRSGDEQTAEQFEPSRSDLPGNTGESLQDPRLAPRRRARRNPEEHSPMSEFMHVAKRQPPWIWGVVGVGLAFFVLLLIALAR